MPLLYHDAQSAVNTLHQLLTHLLYPTMESVINDPLARWLYLLDVGYKNDHELEVLSNMTEGMRAFAKKYNRSLTDPKLRALYELELSAQRDQASRDYSVEMQTYEKVVRSALNKGLSREIIYALVDAPHAEVDAIITKVQAEH